MNAKATHERPNRQEVNPIDNFEQNLEEIVQNLPTVTTDNKEETEKIKIKIGQLTNRIATLHQISFNEALIGISLLFQIGGYLKNVTNRKIKVGLIEFTKKELLFISDQIENPYTLRSMARSIKDTIAKVAQKNKTPGHLYAQYKIENPSHDTNLDNPESMEIASYCADFQIDNPKAPLTVREFLAKRSKTNRKS